METNVNFPVLYNKTSNGSIYKWHIWTDGPYIKTKFGLIDGKQQLNIKKVTAKSLGRSNETTPEEQAVIEARSQWKVKLDKGYKENKKDSKQKVDVLPMLAKEYNKHHSKIEFPAYIQPKLDGLRCMAFYQNGELCLISRRGKKFNLPHLFTEIKKSTSKTNDFGWGALHSRGNISNNY